MQYKTNDDVIHDTATVLLRMYKDRQEDIDMVENFNFDEDE